MKLKDCLYVSYDGLLDPLGRSQVLPYVFGLVDAGYSFTILSFEKTDHSLIEINQLKLELHSRGINWVYLPFVYGRFHSLYRFLIGAYKVNRLINNNSYKFLHLRGFFPGLIFYLSMGKIPYIYDIRAFAGQFMYKKKIINKKSLLNKIFQYIEKVLILKSSGLVVLDESGEDYLKCFFKTRVPLKVITTSTNIEKFYLDTRKYSNNKDNSIRFVFLGGARYPYLPERAFSLVKCLISHGYECDLQFINERDHKCIELAREKEAFPSDKFSIFSLTSEEIQKRLPMYDCGLVFINGGIWINMCSPTKIGEYLSSGLHVLGLKGIAVLDRMAKQNICVDVVDNCDDGFRLTADEARSLVSRIKNPKRYNSAKKLAEKHYCLKKALLSYEDLYLQVSESI